MVTDVRPTVSRYVFLVPTEDSTMEDWGMSAWYLTFLGAHG